MKILVIGNTSLVGERLIDELEALGEVASAGRQGNPDVLFSLTSDEAIRGGDVFEVIVHCAASFADDSVEGVLQNELVNAAGAARVARLADAVRCRHLIYCGTIFSYQKDENQYLGSYGISKRHGHEILAFACRQNGIRFASLWISQIYDERGKAREHQPALYRMIDDARSGRDLIIPGSSDPGRNFIFLGDLVQMIGRVIARETVGVFPCVNPETLRVSEIAALTLEVFSGSGRVVREPAMADIKSIYIPDGSTLYREIDYLPETSLHDGLHLIREHLGGVRA